MIASRNCARATVARWPRSFVRRSTRTCHPRRRNRGARARAVQRVLDETFGSMPDSGYGGSRRNWNRRYDWNRIESDPRGHDVLIDHLRGGARFYLLAQRSPWSLVRACSPAGGRRAAAAKRLRLEEISVDRRSPRPPERYASPTSLPMPDALIAATALEHDHEGHDSQSASLRAGRGSAIADAPRGVEQLDRSTGPHRLHVTGGLRPCELAGSTDLS